MRAIKELFSFRKSITSLAQFAEIKGFKTQKEFARFLGISESHLSHYLSKKKPFGRKTLVKVSKKTGITLENLIQ